MSVDWASEYLTSLLIIKEKIKELNPKMILDIGCGDGRLINDLSKTFVDKSFFGIDYSAKAIQFAKIMSERNNAKFQLENILDKQPEGNKKYDFVTLVEVLEHIPINSLNNFIIQALKRVKKDGYFLIIVPHENKKLISKHFQHFNVTRLKEVLESCSQRIKFIETLYMDKQKWYLHFFRRLAKNRFYTIHFLWQAYLKFSLYSFPNLESDCGRILIVAKIK